MDATYHSHQRTDDTELFNHSPAYTTHPEAYLGLERILLTIYPRRTVLLLRAYGANLFSSSPSYDFHVKTYLILAMYLMEECDTSDGPLRQRTATSVCESNPIN